MAVGAVGAGDGVVPAVGALPDPQVRGAPVADRAPPHDLDVLPHVPGDDGDRRTRRVGEAVHDHRVGSRPLGHEGARVIDLADGARGHDAVRRNPEGGELHRVVGHRVPGGVRDLRLEEDHVAGPHRFVRRAAQRDRGDRVGEHLDGGVARRLLGGDRQGGLPGAHQGEHAEGVHARHRWVRAAPPDLHVMPDGPRDIGDRRAQADLGPGVEVPRQVRDLDGRYRGVRDRHRDLHHDRGLGPPVEVLRVLRHHRDQDVLTGAVGLHDPRRVDPDRAPAAGIEHHLAVHRVALAVPDLGLERQRVADLEFELGWRDDDFGGLRAGVRLLFLGQREPRSQREGEAERDQQPRLRVRVLHRPFPPTSGLTARPSSR